MLDDKKSEKKMAKPSVPPGKPRPEPSKPASSSKDVEVAAYYNWINRGCPHGDDQKDWFEAQKNTKKPK